MQERRVTEFSEEQIATLRAGGAIRIYSSDLEKDVVLLAAETHESIEQVLQDSLSDLREQRAVADYAKQVVSKGIRDDQAANATAGT